MTLRYTSAFSAAMSNKPASAYLIHQAPWKISPLELVSSAVSPFEPHEGDRLFHIELTVPDHARVLPYTGSGMISAVVTEYEDAFAKNAHYLAYSYVTDDGRTIDFEANLSASLTILRVIPRTWNKGLDIAHPDFEAAIEFVRIFSSNTKVQMQDERLVAGDEDQFYPCAGRIAPLNCHTVLLAGVARDIVGEPPKHPVYCTRCLGSIEDIEKYRNLREDGYSTHVAALMSGLIDPLDPGE